ncbi:hypothetical protein O3M35_002013 [Rhynocoris fuscipes]|uniref:Uncharacterized protein n=1 Tax=Rhynocoris fuscipes TaxID=488301 RepID=A0AAW1CVE8_9HEMI
MIFIFIVINIFSSQEEDEEEDDDENDDDDDEEDEEGAEESDEIESQPEDKTAKEKFETDGLSVVPEETEDSASNAEHSPPPLPPPGFQNLERRLEEFKGTLPPCLRINSIHPFTAAASIDTELFPNLTVSEVIEEAVKSNTDLVGVRLLESCLYLSTKDRNSLDSLLARGITLRTVKLTLHDVSAGTVVLSLSGVPYQLTDKELTRVLSQFGPVIGVIERRLYRSVDTGERIARIRPAGTLPKKLYVLGSEISLRPIPHQELARMSMQQTAPKPLLKIRIQNGPVEPSRDTAGTSATNQSTSTSEDQSSLGATPPAQPAAATVSTTATNTPPTNSSDPSTPCRIFPQILSSTHSLSKLDEKCQSAPGTPGSTTGRSPGSVRRGHSDTEMKKGRRTTIRRGPSPSSSSEQETGAPPATPLLPKSQRNRKTSVLSRKNIELEEPRERSVSLSSKGSFRRKMSMTGRETGKIPWCACWGNGCL